MHIQQSVELDFFWDREDFYGLVRLKVNKTESKRKQQQKRKMDVSNEERTKFQKEKRNHKRIGVHFSFSMFISKKVEIVFVCDWLKLLSQWYCVAN